MFLRIGLLLLTNIAVLIVAGIVMSLLGVGQMFDETGLNTTALLIFCFIFGMGGSFISLLLSKKIALWTTKTQLIKNPSNDIERWLVNEVKIMAERAGIGMPEVGIMPMQQANAFATGWNKDKALVAVSAGMLQRFNRDEIRAVMGHEVGHVANGDMVTMTLLQGVLNTFVLFFSRVIGYTVDKVVFKSDRPGIGYFFISILAQIVLGILASLILMWYSRYREFYADIAGAELSSKDAMISALQRLKAESGIPDEMPEALNAFGINAGKRKGLREMFATHPPLDVRIKALQEANI